jgi:NAD(P)H dehydrogenase (quinone)
MTTYAISAVTGRYGKAALAHMMTKLAPTDAVVALARNTEKARAVVAEVVPAGKAASVEIRPADYSDTQQMVGALRGVDRLLFVSSQPGAEVPRLRQHLNVIEAAQKNGVKLVAYTSFAKADTTTAPLAKDHQGTEKALRSSGLRFAFLRNAWYLENDAPTFKAAAAGQPLVYSAGEGRVSWAPEVDYAQAGVNVLMSAEPKEVYEFGGKPRSYADIAATIESVTGTKVDARAVSDDDYGKALAAAGFNPGLVELFTSFQVMMREGALDVESTDLVDALGHDEEPFEKALKDAIA